MASAATPGVLRLAISSLRRRPLLTNCAFFGSLYTAAEISQQTINREFKGGEFGNLLSDAFACCTTSTAGMSLSGTVGKFAAGYDTDSIKRY